MKNDESKTLPPLAFMGGTKAMTLTPVVGTPKREYAEMFVPGEEALEDGELRVTVLGSGNGKIRSMCCRILGREWEGEESI